MIIIVERFYFKNRYEIILVKLINFFYLIIKFFNNILTVFFFVLKIYKYLLLKRRILSDLLSITAKFAFTSSRFFTLVQSFFLRTI